MINGIKQIAILLIIPILLFILLLGDKKIFNNTIKKIGKLFTKLFDVLIEGDLDYLLKESTIKIDLMSFQYLRIITIVLTIIIMTLIKKRIDILTIVMMFIIYKLFYGYLHLKVYKKYKTIKEQLPYFMKCIIYLCYVYPIPNALNKAVDLVDDIYKEDLNVMVKTLDENPNSFHPYQKLNEDLRKPNPNLLMYLRIIYRLAQSGGIENDGLLSNINQNVSDELNIVRKKKNKAINDTIQYLGLIPVLMVTVMLGYLLIIVSQTL